MKKIIQSGILAIALILFISSGISAQKVAYTNSLAILSEMPAVKQANARLEAFEKQLMKQGESMVLKLENKFKDAEDRHRKGELSSQDIAKIETELQQEQLEIQKFEMKAQEDLSKKRDELFAPILDQVNVAITAVAKEGSYNYIFDASTNALLYAKEETNITDKVKAKLGL